MMWPAMPSNSEQYNLEQQTTNQSPQLVPYTTPPQQLCATCIMLLVRQYIYSSGKLHFLCGLVGHSNDTSLAVSRYLKRWTAEWEADLEARPEEVKDSSSGYTATIQFQQTMSFFKPLFKQLKRRQVPFLQCLPCNRTDSNRLACHPLFLTWLLPLGGFCTRDRGGTSLPVLHAV